MANGCNKNNEIKSNITNFGCVMNKDFTNETNCPATNHSCTNANILPEEIDMSNFGCQ